jgi:preprotein translocase subunit SecD
MNRSYQIAATATAALLLLTCASCGRKSPRPLIPGSVVDVYVVAPGPSVNTMELNDADGVKTIDVTTPSVLSAADFATVNCTNEPQQPGLNFKLTPQGAKKLAAATTPATGQKLALVVNGRTIGVAKAHVTLSESFNISGGPIYKDQEAIFDALTTK